MLPFATRRPTTAVPPLFVRTLPDPPCAWIYPKAFVDGGLAAVISNGAFQFDLFRNTDYRVYLTSVIGGGTSLQTAGG